MSETKTKKTVLAGCLLLAAVIAGCSSIPGLGSSCGPGDTEIGEISGNVSDVNVKGELTAINNNSLVIDDGTGTAELILVDESVKNEVEEGDCLIANGTAGPSEESDEDVVVVPFELFVEE